MPPTRQETTTIRTSQAAAGWRAFELAGLGLAGCALAPSASAQTPPTTPPATTPPKPQTPEQVTVTGPAATHTGLAKLPEKLQNTPQTIDVITQAALKQQAATSLQDALRYAPGITLNSGEGGAHGDNVNLRGFHAIDSLFLDGIRDPGSYTRDSFDTESVEVLQGPASVLFGNGSPGGLVNQTSKQPSLATRRDITLEGGTNDEARGTLDIDRPIGPNAAVRLNLMGESTGVTDRDYVQQKRWGAAPSLALGLNTPTTLTLSYFHQEENNVPDYGIPFLFGQPAPVDRSFYYGLKDQDITQTNVDIGNVVLTHEFGDNLSVSNTLRYAYYGSNYRVTAPIFGDDFSGGPPAPGTPLQDIFVNRDRPSSTGTQTYFTDHTDVTARFETGPLTHTLVTGFEIGQETSDWVRYDNEFEGLDGIPSTPLLAPNAREPAPDQNTIVARPDSRSDIAGVYASDHIILTPQWGLDLGVRWDWYNTHFGDDLAGDAFHRVDTAWSPKAALVYKPTEAQTYYFSYTTSFDPAVSYLTLAANDHGPAPQTASTYELGAKIGWLGGRLKSTASLFRIDSTNVLVADPDDPTLQEMAGSNQRSQGVEVTTAGYLTDSWEIYANYTYLDTQITASAIPGGVGKQIPGAARNTANLWTVYEPNDTWHFGTGINYVGHRFADTLNTANVPGYVVWNAMVAYQLTNDVHLQLNIQNITDALYYTGAYYDGAQENHVLPGQGRVFTLSTSFSF
jgi:catecholate siderophore receptor